MICSNCEGLVLWVGPLTNFTHTKCEDCGYENAQLPEDEEPWEEDPAVSHSVSMAKDAAGWLKG